MAQTFLLYGQSSSSKTTQCGQFHRYERSRLHRPDRPYKGVHITCDSGANPTQDVVDEGFLEVWNLAGETANPFMAIRAVKSGFYPTRLDPITGFRLPTGNTATDWRPFSPTSSVSFEGIYMLSDLLLRHLTQSRGLVTLSGGGFQDQESGEYVANTQLQVYSMLQNQMIPLLNSFKGLRVQRFLATSHEYNEPGKATGPMVEPKASVPKISPIFEHTLHITSIDYQSTNGPISARKIHFEPHLDPSTQAVWPCKTSLTIRQLSQLREVTKGWGGFIPCMIQSDFSISGGLPFYLSAIDRSS